MNVAAAQHRRELSRITLVGERRRIDLVLPADEPIGRLLPDILRLLDDRVAARPAARHLITAEGTVLPQDGTLAEAGVPDGAVLRLVRANDAPPAPVVHDVTDEVAEDLDVRAWRWRPAARRWTAGLAVIVLAVTAGVLARSGLGAGVMADGTAVAAVVVALVGAIASRIGAGTETGEPEGRSETREGRAREFGTALGTTLVLAAGALGVLAAWSAADAHHWSGAARLAATAGALAGALALLAFFSPLGRGGLVGAGAVAATTAVWEAVAAVQSDAARLGCVLAVVSVVVLGLLPRLALMAAGLTGLDDRRSGGRSVSRHQVETALAATHRGLALATITVTASAVAGGLLAVTTPSWWTVLLTAVLAVVLLSRSRAFPLVVEVVALLAGAVMLLVRLAVLWLDDAHGTPYGPVAAVCVAALVPLGVLAVQPPEHVRVRLRRAADLVESFGVIVLLPLAVGMFGVYVRLLHQF
ncbi:type VII secretion integral membrane protein EccD [Streptomyces sp. FXJ1.172]|uniref:type VII secretion integral membrane protein EccD n=1 Tax=Streptomyces sp. FXJ1.172 TaxID=710705 RepID=UPI003FA7B8E1